MSHLVEGAAHVKSREEEEEQEEEEEENKKKKKKKKRRFDAVERAEEAEAHTLHRCSPRCGGTSLEIIYFSEAHPAACSPPPRLCCCSARTSS